MAALTLLLAGCALALGQTPAGTPNRPRPPEPEPTRIQRFAGRVGAVTVEDTFRLGAVAQIDLTAVVVRDAADPRQVSKGVRLIVRDKAQYVGEASIDEEDLDGFIRALDYMPRTIAEPFTERHRRLSYQARGGVEFVVERDADDKGFNARMYVTDWIWSDAIGWYRPEKRIDPKQIETIRALFVEAKERLAKE